MKHPSLIKQSPVQIRHLQSDDENYIYECENDPSLWQESDSDGNVDRATIRAFIANSIIFHSLQDRQRLVVCRVKDTIRVGLVDLVSINYRTKRAEIGITIYPEEHRRHGYGEAALTAICEYAFNELDLQIVTARVRSINEASMALFQKAGFKIGAKIIAWKRTENSAPCDLAIFHKSRAKK